MTYYPPHRRSQDFQSVGAPRVDSGFLVGGTMEGSKQCDFRFDLFFSFSFVLEDVLVI